MSVRRASHAGSWYTSNAARLDKELSQWLANAQPADDAGFSFPVKGSKAIIAPHAGYSYSGPAAAWAYKSIDITGIKRVFIFGPSHHVYLNGCALSRCDEYETPIGKLPLDMETIAELQKTNQFRGMDPETDEDEHSIEMHLPYVRKVFEGMDIKIVPVLVGAIDKNKETSYGKLLAPYLARDDTFTIVSSDFCHWGTRFQYTYYYPSREASANGSAVSLTRSSASSISSDFPIHASIDALDHQAMDILTLPPATGKGAHEGFADYLARTQNTICGRHPIGVLLGVLAELEDPEDGVNKRQASIKWVRYEQSSQCLSTSDSSVSYASAYVVF